MTRLEQQDAYRSEFEDAIEGVRHDDAGTWWRLGSSLFYPTSGGQPFDTGTLHTENGAWRVLDVEIRSGTVWHRVEPALGGSDAGERARSTPTIGSAVRGRIDWPRRFRHMQRHSAQHLLSQAFLRVDPAFDTRSVSLAAPDVTLDVGGAAGAPIESLVRAAEALVNEVASRALPIRALEIDERELERFPLRRPPKVRGRIRIVEMGSWERSACGGTHLRSTAEALPVLVTGVERVHKGSLRVTFRAGLEACELAAATQVSAAAAAARLSAPIGALPERVEALLAEAAAARRALAEAREGWAASLAEMLLAATAPGGVITRELTGAEAPLLEALPEALASRGASAAIGARLGERVRLVLASGAGIDVRPALREALELLEGRGGGRSERAQGAGVRPERLEAALERAAERLRGYGAAR